MGRPVARATAVLLVTVMASAAAWAQWGATVVLQSDYRYRGLSRSDEQPSARVTVSYDDPRGWYAGASVARVMLEPGEPGAELLAYGGRAWRWGESLAWELGATVTRFTAASGYGYEEMHAGLIGRGWSARLHVAPDYYGAGTATAYAELNGSRPMGPAWRVFAHAGVLRRAEPLLAGSRRSRGDASAGVAVDLGRFELQASWVGVQQEGARPYGDAPAHRRSTLVLAAFAAF